MQFNASDEWLRKMAEAEDGCIVSAGFPDPIDVCLECGSKNVKEELGDYEFIYGDDVHVKQEMLKATFPLIVCKDCGSSCSDWRGEIARDKAVREHVGSACA